MHRDVVPQLRVQCLRRLGRAVLVDEPEPDGRTEDHADDQGVGTLAEDRRQRRRGGEQQEQRRAHLRPQQRQHANPVGAHGIGSELVETALRLVRRQPVPGGAQRHQRLLGVGRSEVDEHGVRAALHSTSLLRRPGRWLGGARTV